MTGEAADGATAIYSSGARSLVDAVYNWSRFDTLPRAFEWIKNELASGKVTAAELVNLTLRFGNQGTVRRIGALLERENVSSPLLAKLERKLKNSASVIAWTPNRPRRGTASKRWGGDLQ